LKQLKEKGNRIYSPPRAVKHLRVSLPRTFSPVAFRVFEEKGGNRGLVVSDCPFDGRITASGGVYGKY
jgi:hypothetical protein